MHTEGEGSSQNSAAKYTLQDMEMKVFRNSPTERHSVTSGVMFVVLVQSDHLYLGRWWSYARKVPARLAGGDVRYVHPYTTQLCSCGPSIQRVLLSVSLHTFYVGFFPVELFLYLLKSFKKKYIICCFQFF